MIEEKRYECTYCHKVKGVSDGVLKHDCYLDCKSFECFDCLRKTTEKPRTDDVGIHKIIDDAMEKGDRSVYILYHDGNLSVDIRPYIEEKSQWVWYKDKNYPVCSNCGYNNNTWDCTPYCPQCGEFMHGVRKEKD